MGKSSINGPFSMVMLNNQMVLYTTLYMGYYRLLPQFMRAITMDTVYHHKPSEMFAGLYIKANEL